MSLSEEPDYNIYVERIFDILSKSAKLLPKTVGNSTTEEDLVNQIIKYELPLPENPREGPDPPHIFISIPPKPTIRREQQGRNSRDAQGPYALYMEFWIVVVVSDRSDFILSQQKLYKIISVVTTLLQQNKRLIDPTTLLNPLAVETEYDVFPYLLDIDQKDIVSKNIVLKPKVGINLRV